MPFFAQTHDVKPRHYNLVQAAFDAPLGHDGKVLVAVLSAQLMTLIPTLILNLASSWSLSWTSSLPAVGYALFTHCGSALSRSGCSFLPVMGSSLILLWTPLCTRLSGPVSASRAEPRVHHRTFSHVLRHNFPSEAAHASLNLRTLSHVLRVVWETPAPLWGRHCAWRSVIPELGFPPCRRHGRGFRRATCGPLCASLELPRRWSLCLEGLYANRVLHLSSGFALLGFPRSCTRLLWIVVFPSSSESGDQSEYGHDRPRSCSSCVLPWSGCVRFGLRGALPPKLSELRLSSHECVRHSFPQLSTLRFGCVPRGQWAPLDADMFELIDRSSCLVEPVVVGRAILLLPVLAQTCTQHIQHRVRSLLANIPIARPRGRSCAPRAAHSSRAAPVALVTKSSRLTVLCTLSP